MRGDAGDSPAAVERGRDRLLVLLALGAGIVDAVSLTVLGVFTAAVTANAVLIGIQLGTGSAHTAARAAVAFAGFSVGVLVAAWVLRRDLRMPRPSHAPHVLGTVAAIQLAFLLIWLLTDAEPEGLALDALALLSALAMGGQTAAARAWHTGISTTYISGTLTHLLSELASRTGTTADRLRRFGVVAGVVVGATIGALVLEHARDAVAVLPVATTLVVAFGARRLLRRWSGRAPDALPIEGDHEDERPR